MTASQEMLLKFALSPPLLLKKKKKGKKKKGK
jgi:hypothetical protein